MNTVFKSMKRKRTHTQKTRAELKEEIAVLKSALQFPGPPPAESATLTELRKYLEQLTALKMLETDGTSTLAKQLIEDGIELPPPESLNDNDLYEKLWQVIHGMANRKHYLIYTDHLNDRQLYTRLWSGILNVPTHDMTDAGNSMTTFDLSEGSDSLGDIYLQYYASEWDRSDWQATFPEQTIPPVKPLVCSRGNQLPSVF